MAVLVWLTFGEGAGGLLAGPVDPVRRALALLREGDGDKVVLDARRWWPHSRVAVSENMRISRRRLAASPPHRFARRSVHFT